MGVHGCYSSPNMKRNAPGFKSYMPVNSLYNFSSILNLISVRKLPIFARADPHFPLASVFAQEGFAHRVTPPTLPYMEIETEKSHDPPPAPRIL